MSEKVILEMTPTTARMLMTACEFYFRAMIGQFDYCVDVIADGIPWERDIKHSKMYEEEHKDEFDGWIERREASKTHAEYAKQELFPELGRFGSYGVGKCAEADIAWQVNEVVRHTLAWHYHPEGGWTVDFDKPMQWTDEPLPACRIEVDT